MKGPWRALFYHGSSKICLAGSILGSIWGSMMVQEGLWALVELHNDQKKCFKCLEGLESVKCTNCIFAWIFLENHEIHFRVPTVSIEGQGRILDPIRITSRLPRVPWYGLYSLKGNKSESHYRSERKQ